jgi:AcrR family transcriptional regulator
VNPRPNLLAGEDLPAEPRQQRSLKKRARLKEAGLACFGKKGYEATSIDDIARKAKLAVGGFYLHFRSKRQLIVVFMDELLEKLANLDLRPQAQRPPSAAPAERGTGTTKLSGRPEASPFGAPSPKELTDVEAALKELLRHAFSHDLHYLGACRAWQEAMLSDLDLAKKNEQIHAWTTGRTSALFQMLQKLPGARPQVDVVGLARVMDSFFWSLLARAGRMTEAELDPWIDSSAHLIYHSLFLDSRPYS